MTEPVADVFRKHKQGAKYCADATFTLRMSEGRRVVMTKVQSLSHS